MRIAIHSSTTNRGSVAEVSAEVRRAAHAGVAAYWAPMLNGLETLVTLAHAGAHVAPLELGTAVAPIPLRSPFAMAQEAMTVQEILGGRLALGIGTSHEALVSSLFRTEWHSPIAHMRSYLEELLELLDGRAPERLRPRVDRPPVLLGAVNPRMAALAAELADGIVTWVAGLRTFEDVLVPATASRAADRPFRLVAGLPLCITDDVESARGRVDRTFGAYDALPSYQRVFQREGVAGTAELSLVGDERFVAGELDRFADAGVTEFAAHVVASDLDLERTWAFLADRAAP